MAEQYADANTPMHTTTTTTTTTTKGRRFVKRGIDAEGHTANFVETEQLFIAQEDGALTSYVQVNSFLKNQNGTFAVPTRT